MNMILAKHAFKVDRSGVPLKKFFTEQQWDKLFQTSKYVGGELRKFDKSAWIEVVPAPDNTPEPLPKKKPAAKKTPKKPEADELIGKDVTAAKAKTKEDE